MFKDVSSPLLLNKGEEFSGSDFNAQLLWIAAGFAVDYCQGPAGIRVNGFLKTHDLVLPMTKGSYIAALSECRMIGLSRLSLMHLYRNFRETRVLRDKLKTVFLEKKDKYLNSLAGKSCFDKYVDLLENYPGLTETDGSKYIAAYLGMDEYAYTAFLKNFHTDVN